MMFTVTHTTPRKVFGHLLRLQKEGGELLENESLDQRGEGMWSYRVYNYLGRISTDPETFARLNYIDPPTLDINLVERPQLTKEEMTQIQYRHVRKTLVTLAGAIEQFEAQFEDIIK